MRSWSPWFRQAVRRTRIIRRYTCPYLRWEWHKGFRGNHLELVDRPSGAAPWLNPQGVAYRKALGYEEPLL